MDRDCGGEVVPALSRTVAVNAKVPGADGVPAIAPVEEFSDKPPGSDPPLTVQLL